MEERGEEEQSEGVHRMAQRAWREGGGAGTNTTEKHFEELKQGFEM